jgi:hypothetical protein
MRSIEAPLPSLARTIEATSSVVIRGVTREETEIVRLSSWHVEIVGARGSPDIAWLLTAKTAQPHLYAADGALPAGVDAALPGRQANDLVLWIASRRSVVVGDTLVDFGGGLEIHEPWLWTTTREQVMDQLRPLLNLPVEHVLATHGGPHDRAALERLFA